MYSGDWTHEILPCEQRMRKYLLNLRAKQEETNSSFFHFFCIFNNVYYIFQLGMTRAPERTIRIQGVRGFDPLQVYHIHIYK